MKHNCVIVTGASRGIGAAVAIALAETGITVGCLSRSGQNPCPSDANESLKQRFIAVACDVTDESALSAAVQKVAETSNSEISGIVNNAGQRAIRRPNSRRVSPDDGCQRASRFAGLPGGLPLDA